jgi:hypothetical protein
MPKSIALTITCSTVVMMRPPPGLPTTSQVRAEMQRAGYVLVREHGFLPNQYFLVFRPL